MIPNISAEVDPRHNHENDLVEVLLLTDNVQKENLPGGLVNLLKATRNTEYQHINLRAFESSFCSFFFRAVCSSADCCSSRACDQYFSNKAKTTNFNDLPLLQKTYSKT